MSEPQEVWKPVVGYETTHEVSNHGRVRLLVGNRLHPAGHIQNVYRGAHGNLLVRLTASGSTWVGSVSKIVYLAFGANVSTVLHEEDADLPGEEWRPAPGFEGHYAVSSLGRVRRTAGSQTTGGSRVGRIQKPAPARGGYQTVTLCTESGKTRLMVHRLVAAAFIGPRPEGLQVNHKDGNKTNNRPENLEYMTQSENQLHATRVLGVGTGEGNGAAKLTWSQVGEIRSLHANGRTTTVLSKMFGVHRDTISLIIRGKTWVIREF